MAEVETVQQAYVTYQELNQEDKQTFRRTVSGIRSQMTMASDHRESIKAWLACPENEVPAVIRTALESVMARGNKGPNVGDQAPDFCLYRLGGEEKIQLSHFQGHQPVGLVFGSYT